MVLDIRLFGTGQARYCGDPLAHFPTLQCHLLLCYLLLNRRYPHHRDQLAAVFWGDCTSSIARKHLRNALWRLTCALRSGGADAGEYVLLRDDTVCFSSSSSYSLDVEAFETTINRYQSLPGERLTADQAAHLEEGDGLYVGDLLEGVYDDWCLYDRERLKLLHLDTLHKLMDFHESNGTYERGLACGQSILVCDPARETVHRSMMRLHWLLGDRCSALAQYKRCVQVLREELGIAPTEQTQLLHKRMVRNQFDPVNHGVDPHVPHLDKMAAADSIGPLAENALQKLRRLQAVTQETGTELQHIEHLIEQALLSAKHA